jgi:hypothetical protein
MKKVFLISFVATSLFAGKPCANEGNLHEYKLQLLLIRTQLGYDLPPEERWHAELTFQQKMTLFNKFKALLWEFQWNKEQLNGLFEDTHDKKYLLYLDIDAEFERDNEKYERAMNREWLWLPEEEENDAIDWDVPISNDVPDSLINDNKSD